MSSWLLSGAVFSFVWAAGILVAAQSRGRFMHSIVPAGILAAGGLWLLSGSLHLGGTLREEWKGFHLPPGFLIGPLVLFYVRVLLNGSIRSIDALHVIPSALSLLVLGIRPYSDAEFMTPATGALNLGLKVSVLVYTGIVSVLLFRQLPRNPRYLPLIVLYGSIILDLAAGIAGIVLTVPLLTAASAAGLPVILIAAFLASCRWPEMLGSLRHDVLKRRYERSRLIGMDVAGVLEKLRDLMEREKAYSDEDLSLSSLASELGISAHQLSEILNERLQKSFSAFVNEYRVKEARELIVREPDRPLLSIAHAAGFNSKSSFNRAFRQATGQTPKQFRQSAGLILPQGRL